MKRVASLVLIFACLLAICSCKKHTETADVSQPTMSNNVSETEIDASSLPTEEVDTPAEMSSSADDDAESFNVF